MSNYERVLVATQTALQQHIIEHPILAHVEQGHTTREEYLSYLTETYHMVRHTPRMLALAAARLEDDQRGLRDWFLEQAEEEANHDIFCIKDIRHLGYEPAQILDRPPLPGSWGLVAQNYYMATYGRPEGILGVASLTEGLGASLAGRMADILNAKQDWPRNTTTFLRSHSGFDAQHLEDCKRAINALISSPEALHAVIQGRRMTIHLYAQMFTNVLENPIQTAPLHSQTGLEA